MSHSVSSCLSYCTEDNFVEDFAVAGIDGDEPVGLDAENALDEFGGEGTGEVLFVADGPDDGGRRVFADDFEDVTGFEDVFEGGVGDEENCISVAEVVVPEGAESVLSSEVPDGEFVRSESDALEGFDVDGDGGVVVAGDTVGRKEFEHGGFADAPLTEETDFEHSDDDIVEFSGKAFKGFTKGNGGLDVGVDFVAEFAEKEVTSFFQSFFDFFVFIAHIDGEN